jgi:hypothetical protein
MLGTFRTPSVGKNLVDSLLSWGPEGSRDPSLVYGWCSGVLGSLLPTSVFQRLWNKVSYDFSFWGFALSTKLSCSWKNKVK